MRWTFGGRAWREAGEAVDGATKGAARVTLQFGEGSALGGLTTDEAWTEVPSEAAASGQAAVACRLVVQVIVPFPSLLTAATAAEATATEEWEEEGGPISTAAAGAPESRQRRWQRWKVQQWQCHWR